jgi:hypothetical protein
MSAEDAAAETAAPSESTVSESSPSPALSQPAAETSAQPTPPVTPAAEPGKTAKETVLDAVLKVIPADTETDALVESKAAPDATTPEEGTTETDTEEDDEAEPPADASTPMIRKKINKLLKKYHTQKKELYEASQELQALRPQAEIGGQMQTFARENDLSAQDRANLMQIGSFVRAGNYKAFYEAVAPIVRRAQEYLGIALPKEARDAVQQGRMSEASAREYVRLQMDKQLTETSLNQQRQIAANQALQSTQDYVQRTVSALEAQFAASDPDYSKKSAFVLQTAKAKLHDRGGTISNVQEALAITREAYDEVNATLRKMQPGVRATSRQPNGNGQTRSARPEPANPYEAALQGLERARNGAGY